MKKASIVLLFGLCILSSLFYFSNAEQSVNSTWEITQAMKKNDTSSLIRELISRIKSEVEIDNARYPALIKEVEAYAALSDNPAEASILHSLVAEMYIGFENRNYWVISQRTPIAGFVPEDINEWSLNIFKDKIAAQFELSLQPAELLRQTPVREFAELLETGKDEPLRPTLYDYLIHRVLEWQPTAELYDELIAFKRTANDPKALMLAELDYITFREQSLPSDETNAVYIAMLDSLLEVYSPNEFAAEILITRINMMSGYRYRANHPEPERINREIIQVSKQALNSFPSYERIGIVKNQIALLERAQLQTSLPSVVYPGRDFTIKAGFENVRAINIKVYETTLDPEKIRSVNTIPEDLREEHKKSRKLIRQTNIVLSKKEIPQRKDTVLQISKLDKTGVYEFEITIPEAGAQSSHLLYVSRLSAVPRVMQSGDTEILVTDLQSGKPVEKATVLFYSQKTYQAVRADSVLTDVNGIALLKNTENIRFFRAVSKTDVSAPLSTVYIGRQVLQEKGENAVVSLFTDRGLYRPGQNVFVKGIVYVNDWVNPRVLPDRKVKVILRDANYKEVATREFTTNEFGSFNGEFTLPTQTLNGNFTLSAENTTTGFRVEEYKRPGFKVEIDSIRDEIAFGDTVTITGSGQTFSGVALQDGVVKYSVIYRRFRLFSYFPNVNERQVHFGETTLDSDGRFRFSFVPAQDKNLGFNQDYVTYEVIATLTDSRGETQETQSFFSVGVSSIVLSTNLREREMKDSLALTVTARTLNGEIVQTEGDFTITQLIEEPEDISGSRGKTTGDVVAQGRFSTDTPLPSALSDLPSGQYRIKLEASDVKGRPVKLEQDVILFSEKDKRPPVFSDIWMIDGDQYSLPGEDVNITFGTSHKKAYVLYELFVGDVNVMRRRVELSDEIRRFTIPFLASYGNGAVVSFTFIKEGALHTRQVRIYKKTPDRRLTIKTESFRDKLMPGDKENWTLSVLGADSLPAIAEVLAGMYDASLDKIAPFGWLFSPVNRPYLPIWSFRHNTSFSPNYRTATEEVKRIDVPGFEYSRFNWNDALFPRYMNYSDTGGPAIFRMKSAVAQMDVLAEEEVVEITSLALNAPPPAPQAPAPGATQAEASVRRNFNETAFFFPVLRTDKDGRFSVNFTLPESNTTWKLQTLAHTKDMKYGQLTKEVVSSKPLMVQPNMPRFLRQGDDVNIRTQVINQSEEALSGLVRLELFDPATEQPIVCLTKSQQPFSLEGGKQTTVEWTIPTPSGNDLIGVRIIADTETVSDGEQHLLPVLSNEILVTESTPFYMVEAGEKEIQLPEQNRAAYRLFRKTVEVSSNPVWYAVQALPTLTRPENNSASAWFASYYSNILAGSIVRDNPRIQTVITQWEAAGGDASSLVSNLEKNEELKNILLQETPWVLQAANESEQIQRLSVLFDLNRAAAQREEALQELIRMQREDGAWGWFSGFGADRRVTTNILQGMADLIQLNAVEYGQQEKEMQMKALKYLDIKIQEDYAGLVKSGSDRKNILPTGQQMDYMLMRSSYRDIPETAETREAIRFYTDQAEKLWEKLPIRSRVQAAILLHRNGNEATAKTIMNWFKRTATVSETQGLFWANNTRNGFSPVSPIETHTLLMSAFDGIRIDGMDTDRMKQWLLNQKRTQYWETTPATLNAIHALLYKGEDWLNEDNKVEVQWGDQTIDTRTGTIGLGYSKVTKRPDELTGNGTITVRKEGKAPAWGAVYEQYFAPADQVVKHQGDLSIEKKLFVGDVSEDGARLVALEEGQTLRVGDKAVVRLTLRVKQEMTYVHLKDMRAGCFEPTEQLSGIGFTGRTTYYRTAKDASDHFFFDRLPQGTYVIEHPVYVVRSGEYSFGPADIQCLYAPEYTARTDGGRLIIKD